MLFVHRFVVVVVPEQSIVVVCFLSDLLQKISERVWGEIWIQLLLDVGRSTVGNDIIHLIPDMLQIADSFRILVLVWHFLLPPGNALDPKHLPGAALQPVQPISFVGVICPDAAEVTADNSIVAAGHLLLLNITKTGTAPILVKRSPWLLILRLFRFFDRLYYSPIPRLGQQ